MSRSPNAKLIVTTERIVETAYAARSPAEWFTGCSRVGLIVAHIASNVASAALGRPPSQRREKEKASLGVIRKEVAAFRLVTVRSPGVDQAHPFNELQFQEFRFLRYGAPKWNLGPREAVWQRAQQGVRTRSRFIRWMLIQSSTDCDLINVLEWLRLLKTVPHFIMIPLQPRNPCSRTSN